MAKRPNIVLITCDQLRAHTLGCYGDPVVRTPNIDRLASQGMRFDHGISSRPVCMAARSAMLSGQYPRRCTGGVGNVSLPAPPLVFLMPEYPEAGRPHLKDETLPECLRANGYHTAAIGKWHIHSWPHDIGFDHYVIPRVHHCHSAQLYTENGGPEFAAPGWSLDYEAARAGEYFHERAATDEPFFLYFNLSPPHNPLNDAPEKYLTMYSEDEIPLRPNCDPDFVRDDQDEWYKIYRWDFRYYKHRIPYTEVIPEGYGVRRLIADYYGLTTWVDDTVGTVLQHLEAAGLAEDTVVVFVSDHGDNLWSHGLIQKGSLNEESIRVPYIVRAPGIVEAGSVCDSQAAGLVDLMPTFIDLAGGTVPAHVHGQSLAPVLRGECQALAQPHTFVETGGAIAVRTPTHTLGLTIDKDRQVADDVGYFTDLVADPYQFKNLANTPDQADTAASLRRTLLDWHANTPWMDAPAEA